MHGSALCRHLRDIRCDEKTLHDVLVAYAIGQNVEVVIQWLKAPVKEQAIYDACLEAQIALVNGTDAATAVQVGHLLHKINAECSLIYYGNGAQQDAIHTVHYFSQLIPTAPIRYLQQPTPQMFAGVLQSFSAADGDRKLFVWETKSMKYRIPYGSIRYFCSDRNYVSLRLQNGAEYSFLGKLSNLEQQLPRGLFLRIHQSYLVSRKEIIAVDKQRKTVYLRNGEELFISKAHYRQTIEACEPG